MVTVFTAHNDAWETSGWVRFSQTIPLDGNCQSVAQGGMQNLDGAWLTPQDAAQDWSLRLPFFGSTLQLYGTILRTVDTARPMSLVVKLDDVPSAVAHIGLDLMPGHGSTPAQCGVLLASISAPLGQHTLGLTGSHDGNWFALYNVTVTDSQIARVSSRPSSPALNSEPPTSPPFSQSGRPKAASSHISPSSPSTPLPNGPHASSPLAVLGSHLGPGQTTSSLGLGSSSVERSEPGTTPLASATVAQGQPTSTVDSQTVHEIRGSKSGLQPGSIAAIVITVVLAAVLSVLIVILCRRRRTRRQKIIHSFVQIQEQPSDTAQQRVTLEKASPRAAAVSATRAEPWSETDTYSKADSEDAVTDVSEAVELVHAVRNAGFTTQALLSSLTRVHNRTLSEDLHALPQYAD